MLVKGATGLPNMNTIVFNDVWHPKVRSLLVCAIYALVEQSQYGYFRGFLFLAALLTGSQFLKHKKDFQIGEVSDSTEARKKRPFNGCMIIAKDPSGASFTHHNVQRCAIRPCSTHECSLWYQVSSSILSPDHAACWWYLQQISTYASVRTLVEGYETKPVSTFGPPTR